MQINRRKLLSTTASLLCVQPYYFNFDSLWAFPSSELSDQALKPFEISFPAMGSQFVVLGLLSDDLLAETDSDLRLKLINIEKGLRSIVDQWDMVLSDYDEESEASLVASAADSGKWVPLSPELNEVIGACDRWNRVSDGAFDASLGAVTRLRRKRKLPGPADWRLANSCVGWRFVHHDVEKRLVRFDRSGIRFDFGAIGKGWVVDRAFEFLQSSKIFCCSVNFSGNMRFGEAPPNTTGWPVSIESCAIDHSAEIHDIAHLRLANKSISTSGNRWQRFPDQRSRTLTETSSHVIDPSSKHGIDEMQNVTILANSAADADAASTATSIHVRRSLADWLAMLEKELPGAGWIIQFVRDKELHLLEHGSQGEVLS